MHVSVLWLQLHQLLTTTIYRWRWFGFVFLVKHPERMNSAANLITGITEASDGALSD
jgi:hypothetical protein